MRIDAHQHFWRLADRPGQWPPPELAPIYRDFAPEDLLPLMAACGIDGTVLVQTMESAADTDFMLDLSERHAFIRGVVGWTDLKAADAPAAIENLTGHRKLKGLRPMLQGLAEEDWIVDPALAPAVEAMVAADLAFDALIFPKHLPHLLTLARRHPALRIVIDHGAKPLIAEGHFSTWRQDMAALAALPQICVKLSGLLTEAGDQKPQAVRPYAETLLELFGSERVMWGSDWPVVRLAGDYQGWFEQARAIVPQADHAAVFGANAARFYRLER
ncbi:amidohydrolase family protein [Rhizobium straminoryzae]|uniref:Amidohydrolase family protein n=1 Tax=Rhizobium straminoryzae TaxID=1387186 RepID=A0A549T0F1_9HYPH|nr:amidohydrolase family protein [Rhizobium straminoryzae]TRL35362.1 amidohydrolase family protein [Rhizobium straminoryzae]